MEQKRKPASRFRRSAGVLLTVLISALFAFAAADTMIDEAHFPDPPEEVPQIGLHEGLSPRHRHALQKALPLLQKREKLILGNGVLLLNVRHQQGVVAEGTAQIAAGREHRAGHVLREVQQGQLLQSVQSHEFTS